MLAIQKLGHNRILVDFSKFMQSWWNGSLSNWYFLQSPFRMQPFFSHWPSSHKFCDNSSFPLNVFWRLYHNSYCKNLVFYLLVQGLKLKTWHFTSRVNAFCYNARQCAIEFHYWTFNCFIFLHNAKGSFTQQVLVAIETLCKCSWDFKVWCMTPQKLALQWYELSLSLQHLVFSYQIHWPLSKLRKWCHHNAIFCNQFNSW